MPQTAAGFIANEFVINICVHDENGLRVHCSRVSVSH